MESDDTRKLDDFDDLLSRYLKGQLSEEEEADFHSLIADDAELRNKAVATARLARAMAEVGPGRDRAIIDAIKALTTDQVEDLADNYSEYFWLAPPGERILCCLPENYNEERKKIRERIRKEIRKRHRRNNRKPLTFGKIMARLTAAAAIVACLWGGYRIYKNDPIQPVYAPSQPEVYESCTPGYIRGEGDSIGEQLNELYRVIYAYDQPAEAISALEIMWVRSRQSTYNDCTEHMPEIGLLLAHALIMTDQPDRALEVIDLLLADYPADTAVATEALDLKELIEETPN